MTNGVKRGGVQWVEWTLSSDLEIVCYAMDIILIASGDEDLR